MRLSRLEAAGFRGIRGLLDAPIAAGFVVFCGRNGSGKSTLIDAIEFGLTGRISRPALASEGGEDINDYIWWRGGGEVRERFVRLTFADQDQQSITVTRRPNGMVAEIESPSGERQRIDDEALCRALADEAAPSQGVLERLCAVTIIRDEQITELSVDAPERERFSLVSNTLGSTQLPAIEEAVMEAKPALDSRLRGLEADYERARGEVNRLLSRISEARSALEAEPDAAQAREQLFSAMAEAGGVEAGDLVQRGRRRLGALRATAYKLERIAHRLGEIERERAQLETSEYRSREAELRDALNRLSEASAAAAAQRQAAEDRVAAAEGRQPSVRALAELMQHGRALGLEEGRCPLCGSAVPRDSFDAHLRALSERVDREAAGLSSAVADREAKAVEERTAITARRDAEAALQRHTGRAQELQAQLDRVARELHDIEEVPPVSELGAVALSNSLAPISAQIQLLEKALATIDASAAYERLVEEERALAQVRDQLSSIERSLEATRRAENHRDQASRVLRRVAGELVDERLAQLEPLLLELYERLRPHVRWSTVGYKVRGDVRRFLRLTVGDAELNPRFMFSSGQRRALGLAFLLSAHLSTTWSRWNTLVLDDPMQHVDDYRALHLAEVLSAIRKTGKQVLCAVEDQALADLLARRLATSYSEEGSLVQMRYELGDGSKVATVELLPRMLPHTITAA